MVKKLKSFLESTIKSNIDVAEKIRKENNVYTSSKEAYAYIIYCLQKLHPSISYKKLKDSIVDDEKDGQIDAIVIHEKQCFFYDIKVSKGFGEKDIRLFADSLKKYFLEETEEFLDLNAMCQKLFPKVLESISLGNKIHLRVIRGGSSIMNQENMKILEDLKYDSISSRNFYSLQEISALEYSQNLPVNKIWKSLIAGKDNNRIIEKELGGKILSLACKVSLKSLVDLYFSYKNPESLFETNVRNFQRNKKLSRQILNSLSSTTKALNFHKLHNGITIVADKITVPTGRRFELSNPQIVNGCQSISSISNHFKQDKSSTKLNVASVYCRIFCVEKKEVEKICQASNTQIKIDVWELRSNDHNQIILEAFLRMEGIKYNRKAKSRTKNNQLTLSILGQWICAVLLEKPAFAKNSKSQIFDISEGQSSLYYKLFGDKLKLAEAYQVVLTGLETMKIIQKHKSKGSYHTPANLHFILGVYFLMTKKNYKNFISAYKTTDTQIKKIAKTASSSKDFPSMFTKNEENWKKIKKGLKELKKKK